MGKSKEFDAVMTMEDKHIAIAQVLTELLNDDELVHVLTHAVYMAEKPIALVRGIAELVNDTVCRHKPWEAFYDVNGNKF